MIPTLAYGVVALAVVAASWGLLTAALNKPRGKAQLIYAAIVEAATLAQTVIALVKLAGGFRPDELATTIGYLIGIALLIPLAWFWANIERTRFSGVVLAIAALSVGAMTLRLMVLWVPAG